jgi:preprotein translocase subunit YajC
VESRSLTHFLVALELIALDPLARLPAELANWPLLLAQGDAAPGGGFLEGLFGSMMLPLLATMALMYFLLMRPEQKKRKQMEQLLGGLKKNDHVVTIGGICGTVVAASPESKLVTVRIDDSNGTKVRVLRSAISQVGTVEDAADAKAE